MAKFYLGDHEIALRFDVCAMERIEEEYGSNKKMLENLDSVKVIRRVLTILAESQLDYEGKEAKLPAEVAAAMRHMDINELREASEAVHAALAESQHAETVGGGPADDTVHDGYLEEIDEKNS